MIQQKNQKKIKRKSKSHFKQLVFHSILSSTRLILTDSRRSPGKFELKQAQLRIKNLISQKVKWLFLKSFGGQKSE